MRKTLVVALAAVSATSTLVFISLQHGVGTGLPGGGYQGPSGEEPPADAVDVPLPPAPAANLSATARPCNPRIAPGKDQLRPLRWLFFQTQLDEQERGDPFFIYLHRGAETSSLVKESLHWGPGFPQYDSAKSLRQNVEARFGDAEYFDIIFFCGDRTGVIKDQVLAYADSRVLVATRKHECRPKENCAGILASSKADLSVNVNPFEVAMNPELMKLSEGMMLAHVFSPALRSLHYAPVDQERSVDAALMGAISQAYPLRALWADVVKGGIGGHHAKRYGRPSPWQNKGHGEDSWLSHFGEYSKRLQTAKMLLTDAAWVYYSVQKYSEAPTAGALLVADTPHDRMREFRNAGVEVSTKMSLEQLRSSVRWWLDRPLELRRKAETGQDWALHHAQAAQFFEQVTELYYEKVAVEHGGQAMVGRAFMSPFYIRCRGAGGEPWCKKEQQHKQPHYVDSGAVVPRHPASGGPVPTVQPPSGCSETGTIAPHAYKGRWGKGAEALRILLLQPLSDVRGADPLYLRLVAETEAGYAYAQPLVHWGPGWGEWDDTATLSANVARRFGSEDYFDIILTAAGAVPPAETAVYRDRRTVVAVRRQECAEGEGCGEELAAHSPSIALLGNPFELLYNPELLKLSTESLLVHAPRTAPRPTETAGGAAGATRATDVLLVSKPGDASRYPLYPRWKEAAATVRSLGYTVEEWSGGEAEELVAMLRRAKLVVTESGSRRYMPAEWEAALGSGCLCLSSMPSERMREFRRFSVEVPRDASAAQLADLAQRWLRDADARRAKTDEGAAWAVRNASPAQFLDDLIESYWEVVREPYGEGLVGKKFPWSFEATCRADGGERWCRTPAKKIRPHWAQ